MSLEFSLIKKISSIGKRQETKIHNTYNNI